MRDGDLAASAGKNMLLVKKRMVIPDGENLVDGRALHRSRQPQAHPPAIVDRFARDDVPRRVCGPAMPGRWLDIIETEWSAEKVARQTGKSRRDIGRQALARLVDPWRAMKRTQHAPAAFDDEIAERAD